MNNDISGKVLLRGNRNEEPMLVSFVKKEEVDLSKYKFLRMRDTEPLIEEYVWNDDYDLYKRVLDKNIKIGS